MIVGCNSDAVWSDTQSVKGLWDKNDPVQFQIERIDSLQDYNLFFTLRHTNDYRFNNIFLITSLRYPHGKRLSDTLEYRLAEPDGTWIGQGLGSVKEIKLWYKEDFQFDESGDYNITITHAVRNNGEVEGVKMLEGISDVGLIIENPTKK
ncbi:MAG: gliding motility lipoprotein GldH [Flavobacteriaceae bacterium]|nr:gliding motility lipoprotein GldH [Flavobacteriaceae bacterium]